MKLAVIFPGIGYHTDKPLLYYSKKLAKQYGYDIVEVTYGGFSKDVKGSLEKMKEAFFSAMEQTEAILRDVDFNTCETLLFISKSVGTAVASAFAGKHHLNTHNVFYTPVEASFEFMVQEGIVFTGTDDPWVEAGIVERECKKRNLPLFITPDGNHSLETGNALVDLEHMNTIMKQTEAYIRGISD